MNAPPRVSPGGLERVLCVDDEPRVLEGLENHLAFDYEVLLAQSGQQALEILEGEQPIACIVSDMRMPGMSGSQLLARVRERWPDTTRVLLTGYSDIDSAISAINDGQIFRFLCKPCPQEILMGAVGAAVRHNQLLRAEKELLERTLNGVVSVLTDVMAISMPTAFGRATAIRSYIRQMCEKLQLDDAWSYEIAAILSQLGCMSVPAEVLEKHYHHQSLTESETSMIVGHAEVGQRLLEHIPRLDEVAAMIGRQRDPPPLQGTANPTCAAERIAVGANLLAVALAFDALIVQGNTPKEAAGMLARQRTNLSARYVEAFGTLTPTPGLEHVQALTVKDFRCGMVLEDDVQTTQGSVIVPKGNELSKAMIERLLNFSRGVGVVEPVRVRLSRLPRSTARRADQQHA